MITEKITSQSDMAMLEQAFHRFSATGQILQEKYEQLKEEVVELRAALRQKEAEIKRNERLAMLGKTAAAIAHEIRNPLGAIKLFLSLLQDDVSKNPDSQNILTQMHASIERLDTTVSNILQFAKDMRMDRSPVNFSSLVCEQIAHFRATESESVVFEQSIQEPLFINGNEDALRRVIYNILLNAIQAIRRKGTIYVAMSEGKGAEVELRVRDTGPGIPEEIRDSIFEPFVTTRNAGTGLGLAIVHQIVTQHGGSIVVNSESGAEFIIKLPKTAGT
ncbi:MAG: hypothetical protein GYA55_03900 [SAR324 cluster bacterium]|uniref:histidine kinase n=1 Tax=SAR324 cluster bacterium TaxID=2024889 RepID=A0A7X9FR30_9DELT|nr:hypothetical protein [SAR324 cluster bacterium]